MDLTQNETLFLGDLLEDRGWYVDVAGYWRHPKVGHRIHFFHEALEIEIKADEENNPHLQVR